MMKPLRHLPPLDGLRAFAALIVMMHHWFQAFTTPLGAAEPLRRLAMFGHTGVDLFFVLSGFLITRILLQTREEPRYFRNFYARRTLRIFPLYFGFLIFFYLVWSRLDPNPHPWPSGAPWYFSYLQNMQLTFGGQDLYGPGHFWSLAIEEHFYLIWPLLIFLVPVRGVPWLVAGAVATSVVSRMILLSKGFGVFYFTPCRLDELALGGLLAWLEIRAGGLARWQKPSLLALLMLAPVTAWLWVSAGGKGLVAMQLFKFVLLAGLFAALVGAVAGARPGAALARIFGAGWLRWIGRVSYGSYVFHPVCFVVVTRFLKINYPAANALAAFALTFAVAALSFYFFERPFLALKARFGAGTQTEGV